MKLVLFGAGSIGRSFIGQIFAGSGWEVVFVDVDRRIIDELNRTGSYRVVVRDRVEKTLAVTRVRGVHASDIARVADELAGADLAATAVGQGSLPALAEPISRGVVNRRMKRPGSPLDILICENMRNGAEVLRKLLKEAVVREPGGESVDIDGCVGLVETSIGKMVPIMSEQDRENDPLLVFAEAFNTLIVDRRGFLGPIPDVPQLDPKDNMDAYVDRKLYIHNMGHAVLGYVSHVFRPAYRTVYEAASDAGVRKVTGEAMRESGRALVEEYPTEFDEENIEAHIQDLLSRFQNRSLGDTIFRVGRDLYRKLGPGDRLVGAVKLCRKHGFTPERVCLGVASALFFREADEHGRMFERDREFHRREMKRGERPVLEQVCGLRDEIVITLIERYCSMIRGGNRDLDSYFRFGLDNE
jgi:mannitol-1-phosphate 5-dehydrogenase